MKNPKHFTLDFFIKCLPKSVVNEILYRNREQHLICHYSQEGEDIFLERYFENKANGFYIDVGAHHPQRFSNTYHFYKMGWRGINIDATPGSMHLFQQQRPEDINIECGVGNHFNTLKYYIFSDAALNTFSKERAEFLIKTTLYKLIEEIEVKVKPLHIILTENNIMNKEIDFLTIDVEGLDFEILLSNNWEQFRPKIILIEDFNFDIENPSDSKIYTLLKTYGYNLLAKTYNTVFYISN